MRLLLLLVVASSAFTSCKKAATKQTRFIPKEASFVATINTKSLQNKLVKSQATLENLWKSMQQGSDTSMQKTRKEWEEFKNSGVDLDDNIYISMVTKGGGNMAPGSGSSVQTAIGGLKDAGKLEAYIKKKEPTAVVEKEKDYRYSFMDNNMIAWGKDVVLFMSYTPAGGPQMEFDSLTNSYNIKPGQTNSQAELKAEMKSYFNLKQDETIGSITEFQDLAKEKADASFWVNSGSSVDNMPIPFPKLKELTENSYTAGTLNFEEGKVVVNTRSYASKALADLLKKYSGPEANLDLVRTYPSNNISAFAVLAFNPEFFNALVRYVEVGGMVDGYLSKMMGTNYTLQDALKAIKGDIAIVVSDLAAQSSTVAPMGARPSMAPNAKVLVNLPIGDRAQMNRILDKLSEQQMLVKVNNEYTLNPMMRAMGVSLSVDDKNILIATDSLVLMQYKTGSGKAGISGDALNDLKGKPAVGFIDLERILAAFPARDSSSAKIMTSARETFRYAKGYADQYNGKYTEGHFELRLKNDKDNSLNSLIKFFAVAGPTMQSAQRRGPAVMGDTSLLDSLPVQSETMPAPKEQ